LFFLLMPVIVFSGEFDYKIGPLLHKTIKTQQQESIVDPENWTIC